MAAFEALGEPEKASVKHLTDLFEKHEAKLTEDEQLSQLLASPDVFEAQLSDAFKHGDLVRLRDIVTKFEVRRVPVSDSLNQESQFQEL